VEEEVEEEKQEVKVKEMMHQAPLALYFQLQAQHHGLFVLLLLALGSRTGLIQVQILFSEA
jgi:hypothetical protein